MQNFRNYYQILGISKDASAEEIKRVYRRLARQFHPDVNPGNKAAEEKFKDINEAYDILSDVEKRAQYDQFSQFWKQRGFQGKRSPAPRKNYATNGRAKNGDVDFSEFSDFNKFVDLLLNRRRDPRMSAGNIARMGSSDPWNPGTTRVAYRPGSRPLSPSASGRRDIEARLTLPLERAYQGGSERIRLEDGRSLDVKMPPGMVTGQRIRLKERGVNGGDLFLKITVSPHSFFQLQGADIYCQVPVTPVEAILGGEIEVPTLDGWVKMKLPPAVVPGQRLRLANKGYPTGSGTRGDQLVEILILTPPDISPEEQELYEKIKAMETFKPRKNLLI